MMTWETLYHAGLKNNAILLFVFFATLLTYHVHSLINGIYLPTTARHVWNSQNKPLLVIMIGIALAGTVYFFLPFVHRPIPFVLAGLLTFLYSAPNLRGKAFAFLRSIAVGKTFYLAFMWTFSTTLLPLLALDADTSTTNNAFTLSRFFLVYPICILFDRRDMQEDRSKGIRALPTLLNDKSLGYIYYGSLFLSMFFALAFNWPDFHISSFFLFLPPLICMFLFGFTRHRKGDLLYYIVLDGLMMLSAVLQAIYLFSFTFVTR